VKKLGLRLLLSSALLGVSGLLMSVGAQNNAQPEGITVSPAFQRVSLSPDKAEQPVEFRITNNRTSPQEINLASADFSSLNETGGLFFLGSTPTQLQKKYSLSAWMSLPEIRITIAPRQTVTIKAIIQNQPSLAAGGHYGALMLSLITDAGSSSPNKVALKPVASSLLFVTKQGGEIYKLSLTHVTDNHGLLRLPDEVTLRFKNEGNTHLVPRGVVTLTSPGGQVVKRAAINEDSAMVLPESARRYSVKLQSIARAASPGKYTLAVDYRFDGFDAIRSYRKSFYVAAPSVIIVFLVLVFVVVLMAYLAKKKGLKLKFLSVKKRL
jgi:hypothetical protein